MTSPFFLCDARAGESPYSVIIFGAVWRWIRSPGAAEAGSDGVDVGARP